MRNNVGNHLEAVNLRRELERRLSGCKPRELRTIIRNALVATFTADQHKAGEDEETRQATGHHRELVMKMVVEACLDRLSKLKSVTTLQNYHPKIDDRFLHYAYMRWLAEPAQKFVDAVGNKPDALDVEYGRLILGYKAFGRGLFARVLFDGFGNRGSSTVDVTMSEIARRGAALAEQAKDSRLDDLSRGDLYVTARIMRNVAWAYFLKREKMDGLLQGLPPAAAERRARKHLKDYSWEPKQDDRLWAENYRDKKLPRSINERARGSITAEPPQQQAAPFGMMPERAIPLTDPPRPLASEEIPDRQYPVMVSGELPQQQAAPFGMMPERAIPLTDLPRPLASEEIPDRQYPVMVSGELPQHPIILTDLPPRQRRVRIKGEADYVPGNKRLDEGFWQKSPVPRAVPHRPFTKADLDQVEGAKRSIQNASVMDEITSLMMELSRKPVPSITTVEAPQLPTRAAEIEPLQLRDEALRRHRDRRQDAR
jgi:hypothetical protein